MAAQYTLMIKKSLLITLIAVLFSCNSNKSENTENNDSLSDTFTPLSGTEILPNQFDTNSLFISVADNFLESQIIAWKDKQFMALVEDTVTNKYSLIKALPKATNGAENKVLNGSKLFSNFLEVDDDGNVAYALDMVLPTNAKCLFLIDNQYMKTPLANIENHVKWGTILEPNKNVSWNQNADKYTINATAQMKEDKIGVPYEKYSLIYSIENNGKKSLNMPLNFIPWFDDGHVKILFVGDLDGDNQNDIIIDNNHKYTNEDISGVLFSTKASGNGKPKAISSQTWGSLRQVALHTEGC